MKKVLIFFMVMAVFSALLLCGCSEQKTSGDNGSERPAVENPDDGAIAAGEPDDENISDIENNDEADPGEVIEPDNSDKGNKPGEDVDRKPDDRKDSQSKPSGDTKKEDPPAASWPSNEYTKNVPKPGAGTLQETGFSDGIYCMRLSGLSISDAKSYAASLMSSGYTSDVSETFSGGTYLFGGGNANGVFTVVSFSNGQMMIGIQL